MTISFRDLLSSKPSFVDSIPRSACRFRFTAASGLQCIRSIRSSDGSRSMSLLWRTTEPYSSGSERRARYRIFICLPSFPRTRSIHRNESPGLINAPNRPQQPYLQGLSPFRSAFSIAGFPRQAPAFLGWFMTQFVARKTRDLGIPIGCRTIGRTCLMENESEHDPLWIFGSTSIRLLNPPVGRTIEIASNGTSEILLVRNICLQFFSS